MKKLSILILSALLTAVSVQSASASDLLDLSDLQDTSDWVESGDYVYDLNTAGNAVITEYIGEGGDVVIPETLDGHTVTGIASYAFASLSDQTCSDTVTSITIPETAADIGFGAFSGELLTNIYVDADNPYYCAVDGVLFTKDLQVLHQYPSGRTDSAYTIPASVQRIEICAFHHADSLTSMEIPSTVEGIGHSAFFDCENLETVRIGSGTQVIDYRAFYGEKLTDIYVDDGNEFYCDVDGVLFTGDVTELVQYPAGRTDSSYGIPDTVMSVGRFAFTNCSNLTDIEIPRSVSVIDDDAFWNCIGLTEVVLPRGLDFIGSRAFGACYQLSKVYFKGDALTANMWGDDVFYNAPEDLVLYFNIENTSGWEYPDWTAQDGTVYKTNFFTPDLWEYRINEDGTATITAWNGCDSAVVIPDAIDEHTVTAIGNHAFDGEDIIGSVVIPDSMEVIGDSAFWGCTGITELTVPASVTKLGTRAFYGCEALSLMLFRGDVPTEWGDWAVVGCAEDFRIGYPVDSESGWTCPQWEADDGEVYRTAPWGKNGRMGDVNADGAVNDVDGGILSRYFAGYDVSVELLWQDEADLDRSGNLNRRDCMILARYLAAWENASLDWREE